jgi:hypothetical protein
MNQKCVPEGRVDCGSFHCPEGTHCASGHRACLSDDQTDCGGHHCNAGEKCASGKACIPKDNTDCGAQSKISCRPGSKCSRDGKRCISEDAVDCGSYTCKSGAKCGSGNQCLAKAAVDCGKGISCAEGRKCSQGGGCVPKNDIDCGNGKSCSTGQKCSKGGGCVAQNAIDCGKGVGCSAGQKCAPDGACIEKDAVDCKNGKFCSAGTICRKNGECWTKKEIADQAEDERKKKIAEQRQREEDARKETQRRADEAKRVAQEAETKRRAEIEAKRQAEIAKQKADAEEKMRREEAETQVRLRKLTEQRKADELRAKEAEERRKADEARRKALEAEAKAKAEEERRKQVEAKSAKPSPIQPEPKPDSAKPSYTFRTTQYGTIEVFENGKPIATVTPSLAATQYGYLPGKAQQPDTGNASTSSKGIGNVATGQTPKPNAPSGNIATPPQKSAPTGQASGIQPQHSRDNIAALAPLAGAGQKAEAGTSNVIGLQPRFSQATFSDFYAASSASGATAVTTAKVPTQSPDLWKSIQTVTKANEAMLQSAPGQVFTQTLKAAGKPYAKEISGLTMVGTAEDFGKAADSIRRKDYLGLAGQAVDKATVEVGGAIGALAVPAHPTLGRSLGRGTTQAIITSWKVYGAPAVGDELVKRFPEVFIPPANIP